MPVHHGGQVTVSTLAGYGFAKCSFPGKKILFFLLMVLMIMPLQVTLVPNFIILDGLKLLNTYYALALPMIFVPLGTFIMTQSFRSVPDEIIEAARLDGCGTIGIICRISAPMNRAGMVCTLLLSFLDGWNMVEQPLILFTDQEKYPLSVFLSEINSGEVGVAFAVAVIYMVPTLLMFLWGEEYLEEGITYSGGIKG